MLLVHLKNYCIVVFGQRRKKRPKVKICVKIDVKYKWFKLMNIETYILYIFNQLKFFFWKTEDIYSLA